MDRAENGLRIVELRAENVKRLKAVEVRPDPEAGLVIVGGRNAAGKSSVLDAIFLALAGGDASKTTPKPIREGQNKASATVDLGDLVVTRTWSKSNTYLKIEASNGQRIASPQAVLDKLVGELTFDPLHFVSQTPQQQVRILLSLLELPVDPAEIDTMKEKTFTDRTVVNREVKRREAVLESMERPATDLPTEPISVSALVGEIETAQRQAHENAEQRRKLESLRGEESRLEAEIQKLQAALEATRTDREQFKKTAAGQTEPDIDSIRKQLQSAEQINQQINLAGNYRRQKTELHKAQAESDALTTRLEQLEQIKEDALSEAKFPLEGLSFNSDGVLFNGIPLEQTASSEKLRISIAIGMTLNPKLKILRVTDGSLLDNDGLQLLEEMAKAEGFQVWIERVADTGEGVSVFIEDGQVIPF